MTAPDLRALAQRVVHESDAPYSAAKGFVALVEAECAFAAALPGADEGNLHALARVILAALDDAERVATERALGDMIERCAHGMRMHEGSWSPRSVGCYSAWEECSDWAQERVDALRDRAKGGE